MKLLLVITTFLSVGTIFCQYSAKEIDDILASSNKSDLVTRSSQMIDDGYYTAAEKLVDKLLQTEPESSNYNYRKGFILCQAYQNYKAAVPFLEKAVKDVDKNYDLYSITETSASVDAMYYLAKSYHRLNRIEEARTQYNTFIASSGKKSMLLPHTELGLTQLDNAQRMQDTPKKNVNVINLGKVINSKYPEYSPVISFDGSALFYTSRKQWDEGQNESSIDQQYGLYPEDIYVSYKDFDDVWTEPLRLDFCDPDQNEASISVSTDERRIYVYQDIIGNGDIFYSDFSTNRFKDIKPFENKDVNTKYWDTHCNVTPDGRTMYFASERPEGLGGRDIYRIVKLPDGTWSKPFNLGPSINTEFDEDSPFMASDNKSLFYASNGTKSMGGFDIMLSVIDQDNHWSNPVNLGWPLNSTQDDVFYTETIDGRRGYITSMRDDSEGEKDIYEIQNDYMSVNRGAILKGKIIVKDGKPLPESLVVTVTCNDCNPAFARTVYPRLRDGKFSMSLEPCHEYEITFSKSEGGDEFFHEIIRTDCKKEKEEIYREALLDPDKWEIIPPPVVVVPGEDLAVVINLNPIYFNFDKFNIRADAALELDKIVKVLKDHPEMIIELGSHTDSRGVDAYNQWLSEQRAKSSVAYIVSKGISPNRLTARGYGELMPVYTTEEIMAMPTRQKRETAHGRNRRTEFIVVKEK